MALDLSKNSRKKILDLADFMKSSVHVDNVILVYSSWFAFDFPRFTERIQGHYVA